MIGDRVPESAVCPRCGRLVPLLCDGTLSCHMTGPDDRWECKASETWPDHERGRS